MEITIKNEWIKTIETLLSKADAGNFSDHFKWSRDETGKTKISIAEWSNESLVAVEKFLAGLRADPEERNAALADNVVKSWLELKVNQNSKVVTQIGNLVAPLKLFLAKAPNRWVFHAQGDGNFAPLFIRSVEKHTPREGAPYVEIETVSIELQKSSRDDDEGTRMSVEKKSFSIQQCDLGKKNIVQLLEDEGLFLETPARIESYNKEMAAFKEIYSKDGLLLNVSGKASLCDGWWSRGFRTVGQNGAPARMVIDVGEVTMNGQRTQCPFWTDDPEIFWTIPIKPTLLTFDLEEHSGYRVHINNVEVYKYDDHVDSKLVLPPDTKDFLTMLIQHSKNHFVDIVGGKEGGTICLLEGAPGVGKTLTAEVYSEKMHRPLYKVQSSQLGIDVDEVEKELKKVLRRAVRWGAILLIDEADVYIRTRGNDLVQNAIVGVFLRVLEYYRGVLFMTTNLGNMVDDAILSRMTARFCYEVPSVDDQRTIWQMLLTTNGVDLAPSQLEKILDQFQSLSGRDIKNLIKLAMVASVNSGNPITAQTIQMVSKFKQSR